MSHSRFVRPALLATAVTAVFALAPSLASAQMNPNRVDASARPMAGDGSRSWIPYTSYGYVGINAGQSNFPGNCNSGYECNEDNIGFKLYTGGQLWKLVGLEVGYINMGKAESSGGSIKAHGVNLSLVGNVPIGPQFNVFGKIGTTYGWTETTGFATGYRTGNDHGFGVSYGAGVGFDVSRNIQIVGEWERHRFQLAGGNDEISLWSLGAKYKF